MGDQALALAAMIKPMLAGRNPAVQGAALGELVSLWVAGHPEDMREDMLALHCETVRGLAKINAEWMDEQRKRLESES